MQIMSLETLWVYGFSMIFSILTLTTLKLDFENTLGID